MLNCHLGALSIYHDDSTSADCDHSEDSNCTIDALPNLHQKALFLLKYRTIHKVSQAALNSIVSDVTDMINSSIKTLQRNINSVLQTNEINQAASTAIHDAFSSVQSDPFRELESEHLQMKYFCDSMGLVVRSFCMVLFLSMNIIFLLLMANYLNLLTS